MTRTLAFCGNIACKLILLTTIPALLLVISQPSRAQTFTVLYSFTGGADDGSNPSAAMVLDAEGNLYGTTSSGGSTYLGGGGTVFKVTPAGTETILLKLGTGEWSEPFAPLTWGANGDLFGTSFGGSPTAGSVWELYPTGKVRSVYAFPGTNLSYPNGAFPFGGLVLDSQGNLYGTTEEGGAYYLTGNDGGTVFKIPKWPGTETVLHSFGAAGDGFAPFGGLVLDTQDNLYGTTWQGGSYSHGTVFKVAPDGTETILYNFAGPDGSNPTAPLIMDSQGNFYGTTQGGGGLNCPQYFGCGTVFELTAAGKEKVLHRFWGEVDGALPGLGALIMDAQGNLYGTTSVGGGSGCGGQGCGMVYEVTPSTGKRTVLHVFTGGADGQNPNGGLTFDAEGNLYGTAAGGGTVNANCAAGCGVVFKLSP